MIDRFVRDRKPHQIVLANAYTVSLCAQDQGLRALLNAAALTLADGMSIVWGARWLGIKIPGRIAGPDLMEAICARAEETGYRLFLMGSSLENLENLRSVLMTRWPKLRRPEIFSPSMCKEFDAAENQRILDHIQNAKPDILFVGMSCPKQEKWIARNLQALNVPVALGVGAAFNFISGLVPRAPERLRNIGLEWLYRLYREPRRLWKRYLLGNAVFLSLLMMQWGRHRLVRWIHPLPPSRT
jgi:N-acetylglucosaminyldiphosphoundecaprenol N-acetyl-beta-D-mannosaminyltransferase